MITAIALANISITPHNYHFFSFFFVRIVTIYFNFPSGSDGKASVYSVRDPGSSPGWEDPLEKEMAVHSRTIAWKMLWTEEPGRLQSMGTQRVIHN